MPYSTEPLPTGSDPNVTYQNVNANALEVNTDFGVDHVAFTAGTNQGKHKQLTFPIATSAGTGASNEQVIFPIWDGADTSTIRLQYLLNSVTTDLTNIQTTTVGTAPFQVQRMVTPWGLILYYGIWTAPVAAATDYTLTFTDGTEVSKYAAINVILPSGSSAPSNRVGAAGTGSATFALGAVLSPTNFSVLVVTQLP